jgi:hypothetical protein
MRLNCWSATRYHDWFDGDCAVPRRLLCRWQQARVVGPVECAADGAGDEVEPVGTENLDLLDLLEQRPKQGERYRLEAGASGATAWQMALMIQPFDRVSGEVRVHNSLNLWFEEGAFSGPAGSEVLAEAFRDVNRPDTTEFAYLHPYERGMELRDLGEPYEDPITLGPMFRGVYWTNFLGRGQLAFFDLSRLRHLEAYEVTWTSDEGLFVRISPDIADATSPAVEKEMFRLTEMFRAALK